jgi:hypothetical protein
VQEAGSVGSRHFDFAMMADVEKRRVLTGVLIFDRRVAEVGGHKPAEFFHEYGPRSGGRVMD